MRTTIKMSLTLGFLVTIPLLLSTLYAGAQSFNCAQAQQSAEFAICNNEDLLSLDENLAVIINDQKTKPATTPQRQQVSRDHSKWLEQRNNCDLDWACLKVSYKDRIRQLQLSL